MLVWVPFQHTHALPLSPSPHSPLLCCYLSFSSSSSSHLPSEPTLMMLHLALRNAAAATAAITHDRSGASCCCCANFGYCCPSQSGPAIREWRLLPGRQAGRPSLTGKFPRSKSGVNESGLGFTSLATSLFLSFSVSLCDMRCNQDGYFLPSPQFDPFCRSPTEVVVTC